MNDFKAVRMAAGVTKKKACEYTGIPARTLEKWESGEKKPSEYVGKMYVKIMAEMNHNKLCFDCDYSISNATLCAKCECKSCIMRDDVTVADLKEVRRQQKLRQKDVAKYMCMPLRTVENWEGGKSKPPKYVAKMYVYFLSKYNAATPNFYCKNKWAQCYKCDWANGDFDCMGGNYVIFKGFDKSTIW